MKTVARILLAAALSLGLSSAADAQIGTRIWNPPVWTSQVLTSGSGATYTTPSGARQLRITMVGGGGGGAGVSSSAGTAVAGAAGSDTIFNSIHATGGTAGNQFVSGGSTSAGTGSATDRAQGAGGGTGSSGSILAAGQASGAGGSSTRGGAGNSVFAIGSNAGGNAAANSGSGGGGAYNNSGGNAGAGGGAGETVMLIINSPSATYTYTVGAKGTGGASTSNGGNGGDGIIIVNEVY